MSAAATTPPATAASERTWVRRAVLLLLVLTGYCVLALAPDLQRRLGVPSQGMWFLDSFALLAASDAAHQGLDPYVADPLDVLQRRHSYSRWWYGLESLGLTREDNFLLGGLMVMAFALSVAFLFVPADRFELLWYICLLLSPPILLAVIRANNDLLVIALLAVGVGLSRRGALGPAWYCGTVVLATGLKFFPVAAAGALLGLRPRGRGVVWAVAAALPAVLVLASVWADFRRAAFPLPTGIYLFGADVFWRALGWEGPAVRLLTVVILLGGGVWLLLRHASAEKDAMERAAADWQRVAFLAGALLLLGCFVAGISFCYRWVFALLIAPWLWTQARTTTAGTSQVMARAACVLLPAVLWMDGLYCVVTNTTIGAMSLEQLRRWQTAWTLVTQPLVWVMMCLLLAGLAGIVLPRASRPAGSR